MKYIIYFLIIFIICTISISAMIVVLKLSVEIVYFFKDGTFMINRSDIIEALGLGSVAGLFFSFIKCLVSYIEYRKR